MNLVNWLFEKTKDLNKFLVLGNTEKIRYNEAYSKICYLSGLIDSFGGKKRDKILLYSDNSIFFILAHYAIILSGNVSVPVDTKISNDHLDFIVNECDIKYSFVQGDYQKKLLNYDFDQMITEKNLDNINAIKVAPSKKDDLDEKEELATILFTSGSTSIPKGVMLTHYNLMYNTTSILDYLKLTKDDIMEVVLPFYYSYGLSILNTHIKIGGGLVLNNRFMFPGTVLKDINAYRCTGFAGVPSTFQILLRKTSIKTTELPTLRYVTQAGGKLSTSYIKELIDALPNTEIFIMYGQTEATARLSYLPPSLLKDKIGSVGKGIPGTNLQVLNKNRKPIKPGEIGEIVASGGNIMKGYFNDLEATKEVLRSDKLYTGDLATIDQEGFIYIVDREKNIIKSGGHRISPSEIEEVISSIPGVFEVVVIPVDDELLGEAVQALIVLNGAKKSINEKIIKKVCEANLPSYKVPKYIKILKELPKSSSGKLQLNKLKNWSPLKNA